MNYLQFDFYVTNESETEMLIAVLSNLNFDGFEETDQYLKAFIAEDKLEDESIITLLDLFPHLKYKKSVIENINWNKQWEENFQPVIVANFVAIRAHFHAAIPSVKHEIIITPKMSFGTGHHATTFMMIVQMEALSFINKKVLDFGTGTGVLAILAKKMGAASVSAIDNDEWSIENSKENFIQNDCTSISILLDDTIKTTNQYDIILANINLNIILDNLQAIADSAKETAIIVLSGFLKQDELLIKNTLKEKGLSYLSTLQNGEWISVLAKK